MLRRRVALHHGCEDVAKNGDGGVGAPAQAAEEEGEGEAGAVDGLVDGAGEVEFVAEPVDVEEGRGELVQEEDGGVVVEEGSLSIPMISLLRSVGR